MTSQHETWRRRHRKQLYAALIAAVCAVVVWTGVAYSMRGDSLQTLAEKLVAECAPGDPHAHELCYESLVPALYPRYTIAQIVVVVETILNLDPKYEYCHDLGHKIGARVVAEDPTKWMEAIHWDPPGSLCDGGYVHGLLAARFRSDVLTPAQIEQTIPDFKRACSPTADWKPTLYEQMNCFHAMGHLFMALTDYDAHASVALCSETIPVGLTEGARPCYSAVFMHVFDLKSPDQPRVLARLPFKPDTTSKIEAFCGTFSDPVVQGTCLSRSQPVFLPHLVDGTGIDAFCAPEVNPLEKKYCYARMYLKMTFAMMIKNSDMVLPCAQVSAAHQEACNAMIGVTILWQDPLTYASVAIQYCENNTAPGFAGACLKALASDSAYIYKKGSPEFNAFCSRFSGDALSTFLSYEKTSYLDIGLGDSVW